ncbi:MAG: hypothetical protein M1821_007289 [Bathelium mastoideum]|nr:MAG: hypothetical protein M1821_007289 [Bathelium mastoideum]
MQTSGQNGLKRTSPFDEDTPPTKKPRSEHAILKHHSIHYKQPSTVDPSLAPQDPVFVQSQLLRSIIIACGAVGFDSITTTALESFRAAVEEYITNLLSVTHHSMHSSRRTQPLPQDFIYALASINASPAFLQEHLSLLDRDSEFSPLATSSLLPRIPDPLPTEPPPPDLTSILGTNLISTNEKRQRAYIPKHFPSLPSQHTWRATPIFSEREEDPRKIRERATEEGMEAERALRRLVAARNASIVSRRQKKAARGRKGRDVENAWKETVEAVARGDEKREKQANGHEETDEVDLNFGFDGAADEKPRIRREEEEVSRKPDVNGGMMVNYEKKYWRKASTAAANG